MSPSKSLDLSQYFSGAKQSQQLSEAELEIQELKAEIEELRQKGSEQLEAELEKLRSSLENQSGILSVEIESIEPNSYQPRQTFLSDSIESMSRSLEKDGQLEPIILIERDKLVIFDGERRWRSAKKLGWNSLQAVIISEPEALHRKALLTSLHREDLNPLDKAEAIVKELENSTKIEMAEVPKILSKAVRRFNTQKRMNEVVELMKATPEIQQQSLKEICMDEAEVAVLGLLLDLQLNPASIDANIFPMLYLGEDLKLAIREKGLKGVHAMALQTLNAKKLNISDKKARSVRIKATSQVIEEKLSATGTRKLVASIRAKYDQGTTKKDTAVKKMKQIKENLGKLSLDNLKATSTAELQKFESLLQEKLTAIEKVLKDKEKENLT
jgi:ParB family chromosome partitioning protein